MRRNFRFYKLKKIKNQNLKSLKHRFVYARKAFQQNGMVNAQNHSEREGYESISYNFGKAGTVAGYVILFEDLKIGIEFTAFRYIISISCSQIILIRSIKNKVGSIAWIVTKMRTTQQTHKIFTIIVTKFDSEVIIREFEIRIQSPTLIKRHQTTTAYLFVKKIINSQCGVYWTESCLCF